MKDSKIIINMSAWVLLAFSVALFLFQLKQNMNIREEFSSKNSEFKESKAASKRLEVLERQANELKYKEDVLAKRIPLNEKHPFELMKILIKAGGESGLRAIAFKMKDVSSDKDGVSGTSGTPPQPGGRFAIPQFQQNQEKPVSEFDPNPMDISLTFEGTFPQTAAFIKKITSMERLVTVQGIEIERKENILPYQKVSLFLKAYTFVKQ
ncbi:MAG: type 4a pilus biogenesis protein PilO [Candidatus Omnitrophica bacterium]|nr:type 4a pilus biogenesis protein PilO [Candidatus Omnitrophota bacterium]